MGCGGSKGKSFEEIVSKPAFKQSLLQFRALHLSLSDLKKLYKVFLTMDIDGSGTISLAELLAHLDLPRTAYTEKIFTIFDDDGSGAIDFKEFVLSVWNYCTLTKVNLDMFAFDLYDTDGSGELSPSEVIKLLQEIFGKNEMKTDVHAKSAMAEIAQFQAKKIKFDPIKFHYFMGNHQALMFPSIQMQQALHRKVCGATFWEKHTKEREKRSNGVYMSLAHFIMSTEDKSYVSSTVLSGSESNGSANLNNSLNASGSGSAGAAASHMKAMVSGMAALKALRARQQAAQKLQAELLESGNATGQTILGDGPPAAPMTESAKVRWVQSMQQGMSGLIGSMKQKRKLGRNKVYATGSSSSGTIASTAAGTSSSLGNGSAGSILSTVGVDAPVHSIPKPGTYSAAASPSPAAATAAAVSSPAHPARGQSAHRDRDKEKDKEKDKEQSVRGRHSHHQSKSGHSHGHGHGSAGNSAVASPVVSPRESHHHQHSQHKTAKEDANSKHHHGDHKHRGSVSSGAGATAGVELSRRKTVR